MAKDLFGNVQLVEYETHLLLEAAYYVLKEDGSFDDAITMLVDIEPSHLQSFIMAHLYPHGIFRDNTLYIRPTVQAVFSSFDNIVEQLDALDENNFRTVGAYLNRLGELSGSSHLREAFYSLGSGYNVSVRTFKVSKETGLPLDDTVEEHTIIGYIAQRSAALALQISLYRQFEWFMDSQLETLRGRQMESFVLEKGDDAVKDL